MVNSQFRLFFGRTAQPGEAWTILRMLIRMHPLEFECHWSNAAGLRFDEAAAQAIAVPRGALRPTGFADGRR
jgi:hypothetical protein